jgi:hypothetical protein
MGGWQLHFFSPDIKTALPYNLTFADPERIRELARHGDAMGAPESRQMQEHAIQAGFTQAQLRAILDVRATLAARGVSLDSFCRG